MGQSLPAKQRAEDRPGFVMADISLGLEAVPVCVVNTFDKRSPHWAGTTTHPHSGSVNSSVSSLSRHAAQHLIVCIHHVYGSVEPPEVSSE